MTVLSPREAYRLWAPSYACETAISFLDNTLAASMLRGLPSASLLDAGCGVGRRLKGAPGLAVGIDASPEMLAVGGTPMTAVADVRALPFAACQFDMVWCRLTLGHLPDPIPAYGELARVCAPGGYVFVTDFHADAANAGHRRLFTDATGKTHEVEHHVHTGPGHLAAAMLARLTLVAQRDGTVSPSVRPFYERSGRIAAYEKDSGLNLVAAFLFRRPY